MHIYCKLLFFMFVCIDCYLQIVKSCTDWTDFDFEAIRAFLGGLTWSKTLENLHTHWNPQQLG